MVVLVLDLIVKELVEQVVFLDVTTLVLKDVDLVVLILLVPAIVMVDVA